MWSWAMGASEALNLLELSDLNKEFFSLVKELQGRAGVFWAEGVDRRSKEHTEERRSLEN